MDHEHVFVIGEALIDVFKGVEVGELPGGSPANVAVGLGRLGRTVTFHSRLARDEYGTVITSYLAQSGVDVTEESYTASATSVATAHIDSAGHAEYEFNLDMDIADPGWDLQDAGIVHTGSIASLGEPGASVISSVIDQAGSVTTFDPNIRPSILGAPENYRERLNHLVSQSNVVKASVEDLAELGNAETIAKEWLEMGPSLVVVTKGSEGATAYSRNGQVLQQQASPQSVVDTVGAGDAFMTGMIDGLIELGYVGSTGKEKIRSISTRDVEAIMSRGAQVASFTIGRRGADLPWAKEL